MPPRRARPPAPARRRQAPTAPTRGGIRLFVRDWGSGPAVLLLAGWTLPTDFWGYQMVALAEAGFRDAVQAGGRVHLPGAKA